MVMVEKSARKIVRLFQPETFKNKSLGKIDKIENGKYLKENITRDGLSAVSMPRFSSIGSRSNTG